ncbi:MAG TPA: hypothetical protein VJ860_16660 [Polyangia bacterium]|nr:hypothetical protein [Polyangia bacterium]
MFVLDSWLALGQRSVLFGSEGKEILAGVMEPSPNRLQWNGLNLRYLRAREAFDLEKDEGGTPRLADLGQDPVQDALFLFPFERGRRILACVRQGVRFLQAAPGEDVLYPGATAKIAHLTLRDPIEPAWQLRAVKSAQTAAHHQKDFLGDVVAIGIRAAHRADPTADLLEPVVIDAFKYATARCTPPTVSGKDTVLTHLNLRGDYRLHLTPLGRTRGDSFTKKLVRPCDASAE